MANGWPVNTMWRSWKRPPSPVWTWSWPFWPLPGKDDFNINLLQKCLTTVPLTSFRPLHSVPTYSVYYRQLKSHKAEYPDDAKFNVQDYVKEQTQRTNCTSCLQWRGSAIGTAGQRRKWKSSFIRRILRSRTICIVQCKVNDGRLNCEGGWLPDWRKRYLERFPWPHTVGEAT